MSPHSTAVARDSHHLLRGVSERHCVPGRHTSVRDFAGSLSGKSPTPPAVVFNAWRRCIVRIRTNWSAAFSVVISASAHRVLKT
jgi:hypothetical protein